MKPDFRTDVLKVIRNKEKAVSSYSGAAIFFNSILDCYTVHDPQSDEDKYINFADIDNAVDYFIKITEDERVSRTDEEVDDGVPGPLDDNERL